jgi:chromosome segregation ATPase
MQQLWNAITNLNAWVKYLFGVEQKLDSRETAVEARLAALETKVNAMSQEFDALKAAYENFKAEVSADLGNLSAKVDELNTLVNNTPNDTAAIVALTGEINDDAAAAHAKYQPTPAPTTDTPPSTDETPSA